MLYLKQVVNMVNITNNIIKKIWFKNNYINIGKNFEQIIPEEFCRNCYFEYKEK